MRGDALAGPWGLLDEAAEFDCLGTSAADKSADSGAARDQLRTDIADHRPARDAATENVLGAVSVRVGAAVESEDQAGAAGRVARTVGGATAVDNQLATAADDQQLRRLSARC